MAKPKTNDGILHIFSALRYSLQGLQAVWKNEQAFRLEVYFYGPLIPIAFFIGSTPTHIALLIVPVLLLYLVEFINSAIEATIDRISDDIHPLSRIAKDCGSAAVVIAQCIIAVLWIAALYEKFGHAIG